MSHRLGNSVIYRSFSEDQIDMLLTLYFDFFPTAFLRKERKKQREEERKIEKKKGRQKGRRQGGGKKEEEGKENFKRKRMKRKSSDLSYKSTIICCF